MQLEAARIVTGTTRSISTINLYDEIGWLILVLTYKIKNDMIPDYLNNLFPRVDIEQLRFRLRHLSDMLAKEQLSLLRFYIK